jgi:uncharacterized membrane protein
MLSDILNYFGRFHPLLVHLPIGFIFLAVLIYIFSKFESFSFLKQLIPLSLLAGTVASFIACVLGFLLSQTGDYDITTLENHRNSGIYLTIVSLALYILNKGVFQEKFAVSDTIYAICTTALLGFLGYTSYQGGVLTHGQGFLSLNNNEQTKDPISTKIEEDTLSWEARNKQELAAIVPKKINEDYLNLANKAGYTIRYMHKNPDMLDVSFLDKTKPKNLIVLEPLMPNIIWLNLANMKIDDTDLEIVKKGKNLQKLRLEHNEITDNGVGKFSQLEHLNSINLNYTKVSISGVEKIKGLKKLKNIYVWGTSITDDQIAKVIKDSTLQVNIK